MREWFTTLSAPVSPLSNPEGTASIDANTAKTLVRRMFARAWEDGKITKDEQSLLNEVVEFLGMHPERARRLSNEAPKGLEDSPPEEVYFEMIVQALEDAEIMQDELISRCVSCCVWNRSGYAQHPRATGH